MSNSVTFQTVVNYAEALPREEQELLVERLQQRRIQQRRSEIAENAAQILVALATGTAQRGTLKDVEAELLMA
jgi:hypothetical protein